MTSADLQLLCDQAVQRHQAGDLAGAEALYLQIAKPDKSIQRIDLSVEPREFGRAAKKRPGANREILLSGKRATLWAPVGLRIAGSQSWHLRL